MKKYLLIGAATALATLTTAVPVTSATAVSDLPAWCAPGAELRAEALPIRLPATAGCDLVGRRVLKGDLFLEVPPRGETVGMVLERPAGTQEFTLASYLDGSVGIDEPAEISVPVNHSPIDVTDPIGSAVRPVPDPCAPEAQQYYSTLGFKVTSTLNWYYNPSNEPIAGAVNVISRAGSAAAEGHNDCGVSPGPWHPASPLLAGYTSTRPQTQANSCPSGDTVSVFGWANSWYVGGSLAITCFYADNTYSPGRLKTADVVFNVDYRWTTDLKTCGAPPLVYPAVADTAVDEVVDLEGVAVHEWGHVFGLGHTSDSGGGSTQTMAPGQYDCDGNPRTLGSGDVSGLAVAYYW